MQNVAGTLKSGEAFLCRFQDAPAYWDFNIFSLKCLVGMCLPTLDGKLNAVCFEPTGDHWSLCKFCSKVGV